MILIVNNELECDRNMSWPNMRYYAGLCLDILSKTQIIALDCIYTSSVEPMSSCIYLFLHFSIWQSIHFPL